jgi:hypothetical protein
MSSINKKSFNLVVRRSKSYTINLFGFSLTSSLFSNIILRCHMTFVMIIGLALNVSLIIKKVRLTFSNTLIKLYTKFTLSLNLKKIIITISSMKLTTRWIQNINARKIILTTLMRLRMRITGTIIRVTKVVLTLSPLVGTFTKLSVYDPQMLSVLDTKTLQEMDITFS